MHHFSTSDAQMQAPNPVRLRSRAKTAHQQLMVHLARVSRKVECKSGTQVPLCPASVHGCALLAPPHLHILRDLEVLPEYWQSACQSDTRCPRATVSASTELRILPTYDRDCYRYPNLCSGFRLLQYSPHHQHAGQLGPGHV